MTERPSSATSTARHGLDRGGRGAGGGPIGVGWGSLRELVVPRPHPSLSLAAFVAATVVVEG
jgi:hypothetical protein